MTREELIKKYPVQGVGLEIAGLHNPWPTLNPFALVIQLDLFDNPTLVAQYPEMLHKPFTQVHVLDDGNYCETIPDESMEFVFSSHVLEHTPYVIEAVRNWIRVLKPGKVLYMAIPLRDQTFDKNRKNTSLEHILIEDHSNFNYEEHYREYYSCVDHLFGEKLDHQVLLSMSSKAHIHFHAWDFNALTELFEKMKELIGFKILEIYPWGHEAFVVVKKI